jgi:hypothetical protein
VFEPSKGVSVVLIVFGVPDGVGLQTGMDSSMDVSRERVVKLFALMISSAGMANRSAIFLSVSFSRTW